MTAPPKLCPRGHELIDGVSAAWAVHSKNGNTYLRCRKCATDASVREFKNLRQRQKQTPVVTSTHQMVDGWMADSIVTVQDDLLAIKFRKMVDGKVLVAILPLWYNHRHTRKAIAKRLAKFEEDLKWA